MIASPYQFEIYRRRLKLYYNNLTNNYIPNEIVLSEYRFEENCPEHEWVYDDNMSKCILCGVSEIIVNEIDIPIEILAIIFRVDKSLWFASRGCSKLIRRACLEDIKENELLLSVKYNVGMYILSHLDDNNLYIEMIENFKSETMVRVGTLYDNTCDNNKVTDHDCDDITRTDISDIVCIDIYSFKREMQKRNTFNEFNVNQLILEEFEKHINNPKIKLMYIALCSVAYYLPVNNMDLDERVEKIKSLLLK